jgi:hypothetical protein
MILYLFVAKWGFPAGGEEQQRDCEAADLTGAFLTEVSRSQVNDDSHRGQLLGLISGIIYK